jgi:lysophospholipase L1-like esterase
VAHRRIGTIRGILLRLASLAIGIGLALLGAEVALRLIGGNEPLATVTVDEGYRARLAAENRKPRDLALREAAYDGFTLYFPTPTGFRMRANTRAVIAHHATSGLTVEVRTNSLGYRGPELGPKRRKRVLFLGDSITVQNYLPESETWVRRVEQLSLATAEPLEAVNAGVDGAGLANELAILDETGLSVDPDVVVLAWYLNDANSSPGVRLPQIPHWLQHSVLAQRLYRALMIWHPDFVPTADSELTEATRARWRAELAAQIPPGEGDKKTDPAAFNAFILLLPDDWGLGWSPSAWEHMRPMFAELKRQADLHGFELLIVAFPLIDQVEVDYLYDYPQRQLEAIGGELGVPVLDLLPVLREHRRDAARLFYDWCHPTAEGNEVIAPAVLRFIQSHGRDRG